MAIKKDSIKIVINKLNGYALAEKYIDYISKKIKIIDDELNKVKTSKWDDNRGGSCDNYRFEKLMDEKTQLTNKLNELKLENKFIYEAINLLDKSEKEIIIDFYLKKNSISHISTNKNYSDRHTRHIKHKALENLALYLI